MSAAVNEQGRDEKPSLASEIESFYSLLENQKAELRKILPDDIDLDMFIRVAKTAVQRNPELLNPYWRPSLLLSLQKAAKQGLLPDGKEGALLPRYDHDAGQKLVCWQPMVWGILKLGRLTGEIRSISAHVVYEGEPFRHVAGEDERIDHEIVPECVEGGLEKARAVYCIITAADGTRTRRSMTAARVRAIKAVSKAAKGPWKGPFEDEMWIKSAILYTAKHIDTDLSNPAVRRFRDALETDMDADFSAVDGPKAVASGLRVIPGAKAALPAPEVRIPVTARDIAGDMAKVTEGAECRVSSVNPDEEFRPDPAAEAMNRLSRDIRAEISKPNSVHALEAAWRGRLSDLQRIKAANPELFQSLKEQCTKKLGALRAAEMPEQQLAESERNPASRAAVDRAEDIIQNGQTTKTADIVGDTIAALDNEPEQEPSSGEPKREDYPTMYHWEAARVSAAISKIKTPDDVLKFRQNKEMVGLYTRIKHSKEHSGLAVNLAKEGLLKAQEVGFVDPQQKGAA